MLTRRNFLAAATALAPKPPRANAGGRRYEDFSTLADFPCPASLHYLPMKSTASSKKIMSPACAMRATI